MSKGSIVLAAGGTGGHLFPAQALAEELVNRGYDVQLATDERVRDYGKSFPASKVHLIRSATLSNGRITRLPYAATALLKGYLSSRRILKREMPRAVVGFGGYPSLPPLLAASHLGIPTVVHEQNAVLGRANAFLARHVVKVAGSFPDVRNMLPAARKKYVFTGNPVRALVLDHRAASFPSGGGTFNLVVFGGSQGARFFSDFMPLVFSAMSDAERSRFNVVQQARAEDAGALSVAYAKLNLKAAVAPFFQDLPSHIASSHLVVCRSGASTIAELCVIGRPAILVPLPHAIDNDQLRNAEYFASAGAGWCLSQASLSAKSFAAQLNDLLVSPQKLKVAAERALGLGTPDAARRLANEVESMLGPMAP